MLCEDLAHATEQLNKLTEASKKHSELLQSAQEEMAKKEALIQELQHEVRSSAAAHSLCIQQGGPTGHLGGQAALRALNNLVAHVCSDLLGCLSAHPRPPDNVPASSNLWGKVMADLYPPLGCCFTFYFPQTTL